MLTRALHIWVAALCVLLAVVVGLIFKDLWKDIPTSFATICGFATIYALTFTIIEVSRTRSAANIAAEKATEAAMTVQSLYDLRNISECISLIETALVGIEREGIAQASLLSRIVKLYISTFCTEHDDEKSAQRRNVAMVESYTSIARPKLTPNGNLKNSLISMTAHLSAVAGRKTMKGCKP